MIWGKWEEGGPFGLTATGGLLYWLLPPTYIPIEHTTKIWVYSVYTVICCISASRFAIQNEYHEFNPQKMTDDLVIATEVTRAGKYYGEEEADKALKAELQRVIPTATVLGGFALGSICVLCDLFDLLGGGHSMLASVNIIFSVFEIWKKEKILRTKREI